MGFGIEEATQFARALATIAHARHLAVGQKNTPQLGAERAAMVGFDFAVSEECARYAECDAYRNVYGDHVLDIEYDRPSFDITCREVGLVASVVLRDRQVFRPGSATYQQANC